MAIEKINADDFALHVLSEMKKYTEDVEEGISEEVKKAGDGAVEKLKSVVLPPESEAGIKTKPSKRRNWDTYSKGWKNLFEYGANYSRAIIHNYKHYPLTHLLEYGHATKTGGRTRAFRHIQPVSEEYEEKLLNNVKKVIEKGGKL